VHVQQQSLESNVCVARQVVAFCGCHSSYTFAFCDFPALRYCAFGVEVRGVHDHTLQGQNSSAKACVLNATTGLLGYSNQSRVCGID
jgi:hypothetical protein